MYAPRLEELLREDGVKLSGSGVQRYGRCPFPDHKDSNPSLSVNVQEQIYKCHGCGAHGNTWQYLENKRGLPQDEIRRIMGAPEKKVQVRKKPIQYYKQLPKAREAGYAYYDTKGKLCFAVCRFPPGYRGRKKKSFQAWSHVRKKGWRPKMLHKGKRPLYRLSQILGAPEKYQIMVVEGEKCVETVETHFKGAIVTTWSGGAGNEGYTDFSPLHGRSVLLISDEDEKGREAMLNVGTMLAPHCKNLRIVLSQGDTKDDMHDWLEEGGRTLAQAKITGQVRDYSEVAPSMDQDAEAFEEPGEKPEQAKEKNVGESDLEKNPFFTVLGNYMDDVAFMLSTNRILVYARPQCSMATYLVSLADLNWWLNLAGVKKLKPEYCQMLGSSLIRMADRKGQIDMKKAIGRGCFWTPTRQLVWNLGDKLLSHGEEKELGGIEGLMPLAGPRLHINEPAQESERRAMGEAILQYRWSSPRDGKLFLGWLVAAVVGGGLEWRPHLWLSAPAQSGKSWLLKTVAEPILGDMSVRLADATPASLARRMGSDAYAVLLDEAEPDTAGIRGILDVCRVASGGDGERIRAEGAAKVQRHNPRFSAILSSIKVAQMGAADESRFVRIGLSSRGVKDWPSVKNAIEDAVLPGTKFRSAIIRDSEDLIKQTQAKSDELVSSGIGSRASMIEAALAVGWRWWSGEDIRLNVVPEKGSDPEQDAVHLFHDILGLRLQGKDKADRAISDLLLDYDENERILASYGIRKREGQYLLVDPYNSSLNSRLTVTKWKSVDLRQTLLQIPETIWTQHVVRFGPYRKRAWCIMLVTCEKYGIYLDDDPEDYTE